MMGIRLFFFVFRNFTVHPIDAKHFRSGVEAGTTRPLAGRNLPHTARKLLMKNARFSIIALALSSLVAGQALAADPAAAKTRDEVRAEYLQAQRNGDVIVNGEIGLTARQLNPGLYPVQASAAGKTRADVQAELNDAVNSGAVVAVAESGQTASDLDPQRYASAQAVAGKSRAEVRAELAQAQRNGEVVANGEIGLTARQITPGLYPAEVTAQGKTREEVRAELAQARRDGTLAVNGNQYPVSVN
jgi:hypothetical protein